MQCFPGLDPFAMEGITGSTAKFKWVWGVEVGNGEINRTSVLFLQLFCVFEIKDEKVVNALCRSTNVV